MDLMNVCQMGGPWSALQAGLSPCTTQRDILLESFTHGIFLRERDVNDNCSRISFHYHYF